MNNVWLAVRDSVLLYLVGWLGWRLLARLKVPAASLLGGVVAVGMARLAGIQFAHLPAFLQKGLQVVLGTFIGLRFKKNTLPELKRLALPSLLVSVWMLTSCFAVGRIFQRLTRVTPVTAILGAAPGGIAEMTLLAFNLDADAVVVATLQLMRLLAIVFIIPILALRRAEDVPFNNESKDSKPKTHWQWSTLITLLVGVTGGIIGHALDLPAAGLLGALIAVGLSSILFRQLPPLPESLRVWAQIGIGGMIGLNFSQETLLELTLMAGPVLAATAVVIASGLVLAALLRRLTDWDALTCLLAAAPGGVTQFFILACELGADPLIVSLLQLSRFVAIVLVLPLLLRLPLWY
ncbi:MAG TPA: AbrB family transcriptional regulator [Firmicutes bacterium]|nr:AbrB family transcriptional regulator [Bacillota bacterium]